MLRLFETLVYFSYLFCVICVILCYKFACRTCMSDEALHFSAWWNSYQV